MHFFSASLAFESSIGCNWLPTCHEKLSCHFRKLPRLGTIKIPREKKVTKKDGRVITYKAQRFDGLPTQNHGFLAFLVCSMFFFLWGGFSGRCHLKVWICFYRNDLLNFQLQLKFQLAYTNLVNCSDLTRVLCPQKVAEERKSPYFKGHLR